MFNSFKISTRLYAGFGVIVALSVGMVGFGVVQMASVDAQVRRMDVMSGNMARTLEAGQRLESIRRAETRLRLDGDPAAMRELKASIRQARELMVAAAGVTISEERRRIFNSVAEALAAHDKVTDQYGEDEATEATDRKRMLAAGLRLTAATDALRQATAVTQGAQDDDLAARVHGAVLELRVSSLRFQMTSDEAELKAFHTKGTAAHAAIDAFDRTADAAEKKLTAALRTELDNYQLALDELAVARLRTIKLYEQTLQPQVLDMQQLLGSATASLNEAFTEARTATADLVAHTTLLQEVLAGLGLLLGTALAVLIARGIVGPIRSMTAAMSRLAQGDTAIAVPARENRDEIGEMARAVEVFREQAIANTRMSDAAERERAAKDRRQKAMDSCTQDFSNSISGVMASLAAAAEAMRQSASEVTDSAQRTRATTSGSVEGARSSARDLNSVAAAAEQLASSIQEISRQVAHVTESVRTAVTRARETDAKVVGLAEAANSIGDVVRLITDVASQTNLLALNATIEAARAGEAGRGFAVVAGEVKALATQTARATDQISSQIVAIRGATGEAASAVREVGEAIGRVEMVATAIAAAVEEQAAATREITSSVQQVTIATSAAAAAMDEVLGIAEGTDASSVAALQVAEEVGRTAEALRTEVTDFLTAMSSTDEADRRRYERMVGSGAKAVLRIDGKTETATIQDISRGGMALAHYGNETIGADLSVELPGGGTAVGRVARCGDGSLAISFHQDPATLRIVDRAMDAIRDGAGRLAA